MTVSDYIRKLLSVEEYSFSIEELIEQSSKNGIALRSELSRLIEKRDVINLRKGFYLIIPPRYSSSEKLPIQLYCEKLFKYLDRKYYVGLYSAAKFHGASHQQPQRDYLIIETPKLNAIKKKNFDIQFLTTSHWPEKNIESKRSDAGIYQLSSPALTLVDLIHYHTKIGGLNRMLASIEELSEDLTESDLNSVLTWYSHKSTIQRTGFLLESINGSMHSEMLFEHLKNEPFYPVLLSPKKNQKPGKVGNRWKVDVNIDLESDI